MMLDFARSDWSDRHLSKNVMGPTAHSCAFLTRFARYNFDEGLNNRAHCFIRNDSHRILVADYISEVSHFHKTTIRFTITLENVKFCS